LGAGDFVQKVYKRSRTSGRGKKAIM